jgi:6-phosphogluconolactonase/glucosamine-6-phosphate isomerase/deaminase
VTNRANIGAVAAPNVLIEDDPARTAASILANLLRRAIADRGSATLAVSGGSTAPPMLDALGAIDLSWDSIDVFQVDERVAPDGDPDRNANQLGAVPGRHHLMPVTAADLAVAAAEYAAQLPDRFDAVHLGVGPDGHTASWPPGDPVIESTAPVAISGVYQGRVRMTLTPPVIDAARARLVLVTGVDKADAVGRWLGGTGEAADLPVDRVPTADTTVVLDAAAAANLPAR